MISHCPGAQRFRQPEPEIFHCPKCGGEVEVWTDEVKARCSQCRETVMREQKQSCLDWCRYAKECVGDEAYLQYLTNRSFIEQKKRLKEPKKI